MKIVEHIELANSALMAYSFYDWLRELDGKHVRVNLKRPVLSFDSVDSVANATGVDSPMLFGRFHLVPNPGKQSDYFVLSGNSRNVYRIRISSIMTINGNPADPAAPDDVGEGSFDEYLRKIASIRVRLFINYPVFDVSGVEHPYTLEGIFYRGKDYFRLLHTVSAGVELHMQIHYSDVHGLITS